MDRYHSILIYNLDNVRTLTQKEEGDRFATGLPDLSEEGDHER